MKKLLLNLLLDKHGRFFDQATRQVDSNLASAAEEASSKLAQAMDRVLAKLEGQVNGLEQSFGGFKEAAAGHIEDMHLAVRDAQKKGVEAHAAAFGE